MDVNQLAIMTSALDAAVCKAGSQSALARLIGVTQRAVWRWVHEKKPLPAHHVLTVEAATGVSKHRLRPDIYGPEPATPPRPDHAADASMVPAR